MIAGALALLLTGIPPVSGQTATQARERVWGKGEGPAAAEVTVTLSESFLNAFFEAVFTNLQAPSYPLTLSESTAPVPPDLHTDVSTAHAVLPAQCPSQIVLERQVGGVKTEVHFRDGRIEAPLAFSGSYPVAFLGCINFTGWADATVALNFEPSRQVLAGRVRVNEVHLSGVPSLGSGLITSYVQNSLDRKINPVEILRAEQLSALIPVKPAGGSLRLRAREVRPEVVPGELRLRIAYEFVKGE
jgi:hypothetical protein